MIDEQFDKRQFKSVTNSKYLSSSNGFISIYEGETGSPEWRETCCHIASSSERFYVVVFLAD